MANRDLRIRSVIAKDVSDIIEFELKNDKIGFVTVSEVKVDSDHSSARVYVSFLNSKNPQKNLAELNKCKGYVRSSLAKRLDLRRTPEISFILDESFAQAERIENVLKKEERELNALKKKRG